MICSSSVNYLNISFPLDGSKVAHKRIVRWEDENISLESSGNISILGATTCAFSMIIWLINDDSSWPVKYITICNNIQNVSSDFEVLFSDIKYGMNSIIITSTNGMQTSDGLYVLADAPLFQSRFNFYVKYEIFKMEDHIHRIENQDSRNHIGRNLGYYCSFGKGTTYDRKNLVDKVIRFVDEENWVVEIGSFVSIAAEVVLLLSMKGGGHRYDYITTYKLDKFRSQLFPERFGTYNSAEFIPGKRMMTIGSDVWIGYGVKIINSVTIGHGAVLGAFAVVREDVPAYAIVLGDPAKVVKYRFNQSQIDFLLLFQWWELPDEDILFNMPSQDNFQEFYEWAIKTPHYLNRTMGQLQ